MKDTQYKERQGSTSHSASNVSLSIVLTFGITLIVYSLKTLQISQAPGHMTVTPALWESEAEGLKFKSHLDHLVRPCLKIKKIKKSGESKRPFTKNSPETEGEKGQDHIQGMKMGWTRSRSQHLPDCPY